MIEEEKFRIFCNGKRHLTWHTAKQLADTLEKQGMFDEIRIEPMPNA